MAMATVAVEGGSMVLLTMRKESESNTRID